MFRCIIGKLKETLTCFLLFERVHASSAETIVIKCLADLTPGQSLRLAGEMPFIVRFDLHG